MMEKFRQYLKKMKIKKQIHYSMLLITILSSILLSVVAYKVSKFMIERNYKEAYTYNLEVSSNIVDIQLNKIIDSMRNALLDEDMIDVLKTAHETKSSKLFVTADDIILTRSLVELAGQYDMIEGISVISTDGRSKFYYKRVKSGAFEHYYQEDNILTMDWIQDTYDANGREIFYGYDVLLGQEEPYFTIAKKLIEPFTGDFVGYMVVSIRDKVFEKAFGNGVDRHVSVSSLVVDRQGLKTIVFTNSKEELGHDMMTAYLSNLNDNPNYLYSVYVNQVTGFELVNSIQKDDLEQDSLLIGRTIFLTFFFLLIVSTYISKIISNQINRPLNQLESVIVEVGEGNRHIQEAFDESEIGLLGQKFKNMVNNNLELRERLLNAEIHEKEAELLLLQAQINPHFLYNTLDSLYCMAVIEENEKIASMVESLSNIFKLSLNKGNNIIKVEDEIKHIQEYMAIQNFRFNNRFELNVDIEEDLMDGFTIKLILEPFVENAIQHGLEKQIGPGTVEVTGKRVDENRIRFTIEDNGVGIEDMAAVEKGYGIKNVRERIHMYYGEDYGVKLESKPGQGTCVTIDIPYDTQRREDNND